MKETTLFWLISMVVLFVLEAATVNLVTIWFAFGALGALITSLAGGELWLQIVVFVAVTVATLIPTRRIAKKYFGKSKHQPTNADMVIGKECIVTQQIDNVAATGTVTCLGKQWSARTTDGSIVAPGQKVRAVAIEGVKLIVDPS